MRDKDQSWIKGFIGGIVITLLMLIMVEYVSADELQCISEDQALATVHVKADTMMAVPEFKYNRIGTYNAKKLKAFIPSSRMMVAFSKQYPTVVFVVYMAGQCATGIVVMERQEYIDLAGMDA